MLEIIPKWSTLRGAGNSRFSRLTVLTPVFGYIIIYLDFFVNLPVLPYRNAESLAKFHGSTPVYFIYFGLCIFSVGVIIYQMLCSEIVKRYEDHTAYILAVAPNISKFDCEYILRMILVSKLKDGDARSRGQILLDSINLTPDVSRENRAFILTQHYHLLNADKFSGRLISFILLATGAILIALPTLMTFWSVLGSLRR